ncbi:hypothetical protein HPP92_019730 [Vanilla planifolia]|uniref:Uncharacterized protein n=1 Tax=Vanilla planifolia TaxID=51239 RepID=A0A835ULE3_VANPL|nr:hypothetical protein HPP92_019730 [Vanilla planifolia]
MEKDYDLFAIDEQREGIERPKRMIKGALLDGVANTGAVDVANVQLAVSLLKEHLISNQFFLNGLPALIAFPPNCASSNCYIRYNGDLSVDAIIDWLATSVLGLPRILYYSKDSLVQKFFLNSGMHKKHKVTNIYWDRTIFDKPELHSTLGSQGCGFKWIQLLLLIQKTLRDDADANGNKVSVEASAAVAAMARRLSFAWLDGGVQKDYCLFYLHKLENIYETCGPSDYDSKDVPRLFIVRYKRNSVEHELRPKKKPNSFWSAFDKENSNLASQIVAVYNGTVDIQEIGAAPALIRGINYLHIKEYSERDPRIGPMFFLASCISFGAIWVRSSSQPAHSAEVEDGTTATRNQTNRRRKTSTTDIPPSITDAVPSDAHQLLPSDSDSE